MRTLTVRTIASVLLIVLPGPTVTFSQVVQPAFPVKRVESRESWQRDGWNAIDRAKELKLRTGKAKNVILFIGDGMGIATVAASRILEGQQRGESGEENQLSFEQFPFSAFSKTYSVDQQTSDSAPTMSAIVTGIKTNEGVLSVDQGVVHNDYTTVKGHEATTILELAERSGRSTGLVSTARVTHATPGACYAHTANRDWESDKDIFDRSKQAAANGFPDIARQLIDFPYGNGIDLVFGGGRSKFLPNTVSDPEYPQIRGERRDGRDLTGEWQRKYKGAKYIWNKAQFNSLDAGSDHVLGLFEPSYMKYESERSRDGAGEPSLTEMAVKAVDMLSRNKKGYFLMVEAGRIDHGHHAGNAFRALTETIALSDAVRAVASKVDLNDTLILVTADHSHTLVIQGYPMRGNNILGLVRQIGDNGLPEPQYKKDMLGLPFTTLTYANGPGYWGASNSMPLGPKKCCSVPRSFDSYSGKKIDLEDFDTTSPDFLQSALTPLTSETHGGEDVPVFAEGVDAHLVHGSMEENWLFYVMADAMRLGR